TVLERCLRRCDHIISKHSMLSKVSQRFLARSVVEKRHVHEISCGKSSKAINSDSSPSCVSKTLNTSLPCVPSRTTWGLEGVRDGTDPFPLSLSELLRHS